MSSGGSDEDEGFDWSRYDRLMTTMSTFISRTAAEIRRMEAEFEDQREAWMKEREDMGLPKFVAPPPPPAGARPPPPPPPGSGPGKLNATPSSGPAQSPKAPPLPAAGLQPINRPSVEQLLRGRAALRSREDADKAERQREEARAAKEAEAAGKTPIGCRMCSRCISDLGSR